MTYDERDFVSAEKYAIAIMSMNDLYSANKEPTGDMVADETFSPPPLVPVPAERLGSWPEIRTLLREVYAGYARGGDEIRACYMREQVLSVLALGQWVFQRGDAPYTQNVADFLRADPTPVTGPEMEADRRALSALLSDRGCRGTLPEQFRAWQDETLVLPEDLAAAVKALMDEARERALDIGLGAIRDTEAEAVIVHDVPYQGYCDFDRRRIYLNGDLRYTRQTLKRLICHETYPGHMAHMQTRAALLAEGRIPLDAAFVVVNTASSPVFEGLADNSSDFIGWNETADDRINTLYEDIREKAGLTASYLLHEEKRSRDEVVSYLRDAAFADESWALARLHLMNYPLRQTFLPAYWRGSEAVRATWRKTEKHRAAAFIRYLYENMHSISTIRKFS
ncbi:MAG: DUF885 domain-containing protein [Gracilibacteraceae bacterium]|jgi:hypothetical protein|nr:DUF885 domain-containing protein [Gracilibacteraceae bacterium]